MRRFIQEGAVALLAAAFLALAPAGEARMADSPTLPDPQAGPPGCPLVYVHGDPTGEAAPGIDYEATFRKTLEQASCSPVNVYFRSGSGYAFHTARIEGERILLYLGLEDHVAVPLSAVDAERSVRKHDEEIPPATPMIVRSMGWSGGGPQPAAGAAGTQRHSPAGDPGRYAGGGAARPAIYGSPPAGTLQEEPAARARNLTPIPGTKEPVVVKVSAFVPPPKMELREDRGGTPGAGAMDTPVLLAVRLEGVNAFSGFQFLLRYDPAAARLDGAGASGVAAQSMPALDEKPGAITFLAAASTALPPGEVARFRFLTAGGGGGFRIEEATATDGDGRGLPGASFSLVALK